METMAQIWDACVNSFTSLRKYNCNSASFHRTRASSTTLFKNVYGEFNENATNCFLAFLTWSQNDTPTWVPHKMLYLLRKELKFSSFHPDVFIDYSRKYGQSNTTLFRFFT